MNNRLSSSNNSNNNNSFSRTLILVSTHHLQLLKTTLITIQSLNLKIVAQYVYHQLKVLDYRLHQTTDLFIIQVKCKIALI